MMHDTTPLSSSEKLPQAEGTDEEMKALFVRLWTGAGYQTNYNKGDWITLQLMLQSRGVEV